jgi:anaerobic magnesium-protoporphyrin IX monomethyl ester cyclase
MKIKYNIKSPNHRLDCLLISPYEKVTRYPYLGLVYLAAVLRQKNINCEILDCAALKLSTSDVVRYVQEKKPVVIGISIMSMMLRECYQLIKALQTGYAEGIVVAGGAHINADPHILSKMNVQYGFRGESELVFSEFCTKILGQQIPIGIPGLITHHQGIVENQEPAFIPDLDVLPVPAYDLLPLDNYYSPNTTARLISMISSRGCPYNCNYCSKLQRTKYRSISADKMLDQIEYLINCFKIRWIEFVDEIFTLDRNRIVALCEGIIKRQLHFEWGAGTRADKIDEDLIQLMRHAGCQKLAFGVESGSEQVRYNGNKKINNVQYFDAINICRKYGIKTMGDYIFGHLNENIADMKRTVQFALQLPTDIAYFHKMIPLPNSELFQKAVHSNLIKKDIWTSFMLGETSYPIYYPNSVSRSQMDKIYRRAWLKYYFSPKRVVNNLRLLLKPNLLYRSAKAFLSSIKRSRYQ